MGEVYHDALIITVYYEDIEKVQEYISTLSDEVKSHITSPVSGLNGACTISFLADGSKALWDTDIDMQKARHQLIKFVKTNCDYPDIILLQYGRDSDSTEILYSTDDMIPGAHGLYEVLQDESIRVILVKSLSLDLATQIKDSCTNAVLTDIREMDNGWKKQDAAFNKINKMLTLSRTQNQKHIILTIRDLPVQIKNQLDLIVRQKERDIMIDYNVVNNAYPYLLDSDDSNDEE